jgi:hypothetical protein
VHEHVIHRAAEFLVGNGRAALIRFSLETLFYTVGTLLLHLSHTIVTLLLPLPSSSIAACTCVAMLLRVPFCQYLQGCSSGVTVVLQ